MPPRNAKIDQRSAQGGEGRQARPSLAVEKPSTREAKSLGDNEICTAADLLIERFNGTLDPRQQSGLKRKIVVTRSRRDDQVVTGAEKQQAS